MIPFYNTFGEFANMVRVNFRELNVEKHWQQLLVRGSYEHYSPEHKDNGE